MKKVPSKTIVGFITTWIVVIISMGWMLIDGGAKGYCKYNTKHGWHVVHRAYGQDDPKGNKAKEKAEKDERNKGPWFPTKETCEASVHPNPTKTPGPQATGTPVVVTKTPSDGSGATQTSLPTGSPVATNTELPGGILTPTGTDFTPDPRNITPEVTATEMPTQAPAAVAGGNIKCDDAWAMMQTSKTRDVGYRFFDNPEHAYCRVWLLKVHGVQYNLYKLQYPVSP